MVKDIPSIKLFEHVILQKPDVVFNLVSVFDDEKANRIPAILEIANVPYTGAGMLCLSLNRFYNQLFPLLSNSGIKVVPFITMKAEKYCEPNNLNYPLSIFQEGSCLSHEVRTEENLKSAIIVTQPHEELIVFGSIKGKRESLFILDNIPFVTQNNRPCLESALKVKELIEARGLVRYDFILTNDVLFAGFDSSPNPLDEILLRDAAAAGWNEHKLIQHIVDHASNDRHTNSVSQSSEKPQE